MEQIANDARYLGINMLTELDTENEYYIDEKLRTNGLISKKQNMHKFSHTCTLLTHKQTNTQNAHKLKVKKT